MFRIPDDVLKRLANEQFESAVTTPGMWRHSAYTLLRAAEAIQSPIEQAERRKLDSVMAELAAKDRPQSGSRPMTDEEVRDMYIMGTGGVWAMLVGLAMENLLKGAIVGAASVKVGPGGKLPEEINEHDLNGAGEHCWNLARREGEEHSQRAF